MALGAVEFFLGFFFRCGGDARAALCLCLAVAVGRAVEVVFHIHIFPNVGKIVNYGFEFLLGFEGNVKDAGWHLVTGGTHGREGRECAQGCHQGSHGC